jgi:hypothetical protein
MKTFIARSSMLLAGMVAVSVTSCSSGPQTGIDSLAVGTGYHAGHVTGKATEFTTGQPAYVVFTSHAPKPGATAVVRLLRGGALEDTSAPIAVGKGDHTYDEQISLMAPGTVTIEVSYNGAVQQTTQITVR